MRKFICSVLVLITLNLSAQDFNRAKMDSLFAAIEDNQKNMGAVSVYKNGNEVYQNFIGFSDIEGDRRITEDTKFRIGSISKTFTAVVIMQLIEEEKLQLDMKLAEFYPDVPNASEITVEDLLRHQSGLFNFTNKEEYLAYMEEPKTKEELLEIINENGTVFSPGEKNEYSNTNYVLLSFIAEDVEESSFQEIIKKRIADPLNLQSTYYGGKIDPAKSEALSYQKKNKWILTTETDLSIPKGAGGIVSTPSDLNEFFTALFNTEIVNTESLEEMKKITNGYGIGLFKYPYNDQILYGHTGGIDGFSSMAVYYPEDDLGVTYLSNARDFATGDVVLGVLSIYFGKEYNIPVFSPALEIPEGELEKFTGTYSSENFPLAITIFVEDGVLMGQGTGQPSFPLEAYEQDKFQFTPAGLKLEFSPEENKVTVLQGGRSNELTKE